MNFRSLLLFVSTIVGANVLLAQEPMKLVQTIVIPGVAVGPYADHMAVDVEHHRLFTTPQASKAVAVLDLRRDTVLHFISGLGNPHAILYRSDRNRLFVTDGGIGALRIFDGTTYQELKQIPLKPDADSIAYDETTGYLYVANGGGDAGEKSSEITVIDTATESRIGEIGIESPTLEAMSIDPISKRLYVSLPKDNAITVIDLATRKLVATLRLTRGKTNVALALDSQHHLLYVGCRDTATNGSIVVVDIATGKERDRLAIGGWIDSMFYDAARGRIYASCGTGQIYIYSRLANGAFMRLATAETAQMAKTSLYSPRLDRFFVAVPHLGDTLAKILIFKPE